MRNWTGFWSRRGQVQRVEFYTRYSLYAVAWWINLTLLATGGDRFADRPGAIAVIAPMVVVLSLAEMLPLRRAIDTDGAAWPLRWSDPTVRRPLLVLLALVVGCGIVGRLLLEPDEWFVVLWLIAASLSFGLGTVPGWVTNILGPAFILAAGLALLGPGGIGVAFFFIVAYAFFAATLRTSLWILRVVRELDVARTAQSQLAVAEERLRFSRDVHDVMGRHLSTIAVRSELAATLAERGDDRAPAEMLEVRAVAQEALREARALARGYRVTDLATEVQGARSLLAAAKISCRAEVDSVPAGWHEAAGWVIREGVTNLLRHSTAAAVDLLWTPDADGGGTLVVRNDGAGDVPGRASTGSGLIGLGERLAPLGAHIETRRSGDVFELAATLPGARTLPPETPETPETPESPETAQTPETPETPEKR